MNFVTFEHLNDCIYKNIHKIPRNIDLIVGIPRSGTMVGNLLALYLNIPFTDIDNFINRGPLRSGNTRKCRNWITTIEEAQNILVVDDSISSGRAIKEVRNQIKQAGIRKNIKYAVIYALTVSRHLVDIHFEICEQPRMFEWNYMHHWGLEYSCMDLDGIMCNDPRVWENNDDQKYLNFIKNAVPRFIPTKRIGYIVTGRLEKYRKETEQWLQDNHIEYSNLIMLENTTAKERRYQINIAQYKADCYKRSKTIMFFESSYEQAVEICKLSKMPVFCVDRRRLITPDNMISHMKILNNDWKITLKRVVKKLFRKIQYS